MQDLIGFLVVLTIAVGGAELVRATCKRQLSTPLEQHVPEPEPVSVD